MKTRLLALFFALVAFARVGMADDFPTVEVSDQIPDLSELRIYRIAFLIPPSMYNQLTPDCTTREEKVAKIRSYLQGWVKELNRSYKRDIGVEFQLVDDERLWLAETTDYDWGGWTNVDNTLSEITPAITALIGQDSYDIGLCICNYSASCGTVGLATQSGAFTQTKKAHCMVNSSVDIARHEIGHLFGCGHTNGMSAEPGNGRTTMGNGSQADYFDLTCIRTIRKRFSNMAYYTDEAHTQMAATDRYYTSYNANLTYAIPLSTAAPVVSKEGLKPEYTVAKGSYIQFDFSATTAEGTPMYRCQEMGLSRTFYADQVNTSGHFSFQPRYEIDSDDNTWQRAYDYVEPAVGDYQFFLTASNPKVATDAEIAARDHVVQYGFVPVNVKFVEGTAFKVNPLTKSYWDYKGGDKVQVSWTYDTNIYPSDTKVRIMLSDDWGETWKYTLMESTSIGSAGTGSCQITMPNIDLPRKSSSTYGTEVRAGHIKVEVIGDIAYGTIGEDLKTSCLTITYNPDYNPDPDPTPDPEPEPDPNPQGTLETAKAEALTFLQQAPKTAGYPVTAERTRLVTAVEAATTVDEVTAALTAFKTTDDVVMPEDGHTYTYTAIYNGTEYSADPTTTGYAEWVVPTENSVTTASTYVAKADMFGCLLIRGYSSQYPYYVHYNASTAGLQKPYSPETMYYGDNLTCLWKLTDTTPEKVLGPTDAETGENSWNSVKESSDGEEYYTIAANGKWYGTICLPYDCTVENGYIFNIYKVIRNASNEVTGIQFETRGAGYDAEETGRIEAGMPCLFRRIDKTEPIVFKKTGTSSADVKAKTLSNGFAGTYQSITLASGSYCLATVDGFQQFYQAGEDVVCSPFRAYIENLSDLPDEPQQARHGMLITLGQEETTGIGTVSEGVRASEGVNGSPATEQTPGLSKKFIRNGHMVIVKDDKKFNVNGQELK